MGHSNDLTTAGSNILHRLLNGRDGRRRIRTSPYSVELGATMLCPCCHGVLEVAEYTNSANQTLRYWTECCCLLGGDEKAAALSAASAAAQVAQRVEIVEDSTDLSAFTFETFDANRLTDGVKLVAAAGRWLSLIQPHSVAPSFHDEQTPRPCLYFYSAGKGRGKTHLAGAIVNEARNAGRLVAFADEIAYIERYWAAPLDEKAKLSALPGERAWLTILDDLGQRESTGAGLRDAWYDVVNPRWLKRGWTVITSNWTPDELLARGTINEATYSRIVQMTRGQIVTFNGTDQRLPTGAAL